MGIDGINKIDYAKDLDRNIQSTISGANNNAANPTTAISRIGPASKTTVAENTTTVVNPNTVQSTYGELVDLYQDALGGT